MHYNVGMRIFGLNITPEKEKMKEKPLAREEKKLPRKDSHHANPPRNKVIPSQICALELYFNTEALKILAMRNEEIYYF